MAATAKQFLAALAGQLGYREGRDPNGNWNNDTKFGQWYGMNRVAWCAIFQSWSANQVGALGTLVPKYASCTAGLNWFRAKGQTGVWPPRPGDIFILLEHAPGRWNAQSNGWAPIHTGAVERWVPYDAANTSGHIVTLEGNTNDGGSSQGNGVYRLQRYDSKNADHLIYCRPAWAPEPAPAAPPSRGNDRAPLPPKKPKPKPKPIPGATYTGPRTIDVSAVRPNRRNEACRRWNGLVWAWLCTHSPAYARANSRLWQAESANLFGRQGQRATQEMYRVLAAQKPKTFKRVDLPTWPGPGGVKAIGGKPV